MPFSINPKSLALQAGRTSGAAAQTGWGRVIMRGLCHETRRQEIFPWPAIGAIGTAGRCAADLRFFSFMD
jgi:hypothetical protein